MKHQLRMGAGANGFAGDGGVEVNGVAAPCHPQGPVCAMLPARRHDIRSLWGIRWWPAAQLAVNAAPFGVAAPIGNGSNRSRFGKPMRERARWMVVGHVADRTAET